MAYEQQKRGLERSPAGREMVSILPDGAMRLNQDATAILDELGAERVLLLSDEPKRKIAIAYAEADDSSAYRLWYSRKRNSSQFAAKRFARRIGWSAKQAVRVPLRWNGKLLEGTIPPDFLSQK